MIISNAANSSATVIKNSIIKTTSRTTLSPWGEICLQDFRWNIEKRLLSPFRSSYIKRLWKNSLLLMQKNFPIIEPVLCIELKKGPFVIRSFTVTKWIESTSLGKTAQEKHLYSENFLSGLLRESAELIARLHINGFVHNNLKWGNFLWIPSGKRRIILSDLDHIEKTGAAEKQGKDLARFILSALEYNMGWGVAESLITFYFDNRKVYPPGLEKSLIKRIERKKNRYENRYVEMPVQQNRFS